LAIPPIQCIQPRGHHCPLSHMHWQHHPPSPRSMPGTSYILLCLGSHWEAEVATVSMSGPLYSSIHMKSPHHASIGTRWRRCRYGPSANAPSLSPSWPFSLSDLALSVLLMLLKEGISPLGYIIHPNNKSSPSGLHKSQPSAGLGELVRQAQPNWPMTKDKSRGKHRHNISCKSDAPLLGKAISPSPSWLYLCPHQPASTSPQG